MCFPRAGDGLDRRLLRAELLRRAVQDERFAEAPLKLSGATTRYNDRDGNDY
jgi:hypothetical protein